MDYTGGGGLLKTRVIVRPEAKSDCTLRAYNEDVDGLFVWEIVDRKGDLETGAEISLEAAMREAGKAAAWLLKEAGG
jgi:hypothetical protein